MRLITAGLLVSFAGCSAVGPGADGGLVAGADAGVTGVVTVDGGAAWPPQLTSVEARVSGRTGRDLRLSLKGKDRNLDAVSVAVRLLDATDGPVVAMDSNRDGVADATGGVLLLEGKRWVTEVLTASASIRGLFASPTGVTQVAVVLVDAAGLQSEEQIVPVEAQLVRARGEPCDATFMADRCEPGLGCRGTPAVCDEGLAPQIGRLAFYRNATGGPTILVEGTEPEDDLLAIRFEFQNAQGVAISIDSDGDGMPDLSSFDQDALALAVDGSFFLRLQSGDGLDQQVPKLVAIPSDGAGHTGTPKIVAPAPIPVRSAGQGCDARGFDTCGPNLSCSPGIVGATNRCATASPLRTAQCTAAPLLLAGGRVTGLAEGGSLWDAPAGCSTNDPTGRPEGVVKLRLTDRAAKLTLSTANPGTGFDTTLYVMPECPNDTQDSLGCSDDLPGAGGASQLVLEDLPPGDYLVVVDSFDPLGGPFELTAVVE
ncbi:MAG: hypothetical protein Q8L48_11365 [Archangium sp.]|nr:hypothetical protein [Archangium sp.]